MVELLFVYGTLRKGDPSGRQTLLETATFRGSGKVAGRLYHVGAYPGAVPGDGWIAGELYEVEDFAALDAYEGCDASVAEPWEYRRALVPVLCADGREREAWIYWYGWPTDGLERIPTGDWLDFRSPRSGKSPQR